jgi:hypothetical protein
LVPKKIKEREANFHHLSHNELGNQETRQENKFLIRKKIKSSGTVKLKN